MRVIVMGDIHGRSQWKRAAIAQEWDKFVFIGDYFDSFDISAEEQIKNFLEIVNFKKDSEEKGKEVVMLIGNHDAHYGLVPGRCSGYQTDRAIKINQVIHQHRDCLQMCHRHNDYVMTHAGLTKTWMKSCETKFQMDLDTKDVAHFVNQVYEFRPSLFSFNGWDSYGDDKEQGPLWVRPTSLRADRFGDFKQIVGHTGFPAVGMSGDIIFIDVLNSVDQCLVIENDEAKRLDF